MKESQLLGCDGMDGLVPQLEVRCSWLFKREFARAGARSGGEDAQVYVPPITQQNITCAVYLLEPSNPIDPTKLCYGVDPKSDKKVHQCRVTLSKQRDVVSLMNVKGDLITVTEFPEVFEPAVSRQCSIAIKGSRENIVT